MDARSVGASRRARHERLEAVVFFAVLLAVSTRLVRSAWRLQTLSSAESPLLYHAATSGFSWTEVGFVRRGLGGTIVHLLGSDLLRATAIFHLLSAAAVAALASILYARLGPDRRRRWAYGLVLVALMARWAEDAGRTDLAVAAMLGLATLAAAASRWTFAALAVAVGLALHETAVIYGVPLLLALAWRARAGTTIDWRRVVAPASVLLLGLAVYAASGRLSAETASAIVETVQAKLPRHVYVDWALYFVVGGGRGVRTSVCQNLADPNYALHVASGLVLIALAIAILVPRRRDATAAAAFAAFVPYLFLCAVANDMSRWNALAIYSVWLFGASAREVVASGAAAPTDAARGSWWHVLLALAFVPLLHPKLVRIDDPIFMPSPVAERIVRELGGPPTLRFADALARCDPTWRDALAPLPPPQRHDGSR